MEINNSVPYDTLTEMLIAKDNEQERGITFVVSKTEEIYCSFHDIYRKALNILGYLQSVGLKSNDKLVIQLNTNYDFIHVFWACILGGIVPVPIVAEDKDEYRRKLFNVLLVLEDGYIIGENSALSKIQLFAEQGNYDFDLVNERFIDRELALSYCGAGQLHHSKPEEIAFIQFSSGSTGMPKGVVLTHRNLMLNLDAIVAGVRLTREDVIVSWMPLTHDMGLIGCHLAMTAADVEQCTINTLLFVVKPTLWLDKITKHKASILASPNFGLKYALLGLERDRNHTKYDLSAVRIIFNGAEPISVKITNEFISRMAEFGLRESAMFPVYGMAEATLAIAFPKLNEGHMNKVVISRDHLKMGEKVIYLDDENDALASAYLDEGYAVRHCEIRVCDLEDRVLESDTLGIIQLRGGGVSERYYSNKEATDESRTADGWFKTGDLGFFCNDRIVVIGRSQEMVIVNGQNYFSNDLERIACELKKIVPSKVAISSTIDRDTQTEKLLAFVVHKGEVSKFIPLILELREHFAKSIGINLDHIIPVVQIPKTSSGKLMRFVLKDSFDNGVYKDVIAECNKRLEEARIASRTNDDSVMDDLKQEQPYSLQEVEREILLICNDVSPELEIGLSDNFFQYGINSLLLNLIMARIDEKYPNRITNEDFFKYSSIHKLARYICGMEQTNNGYAASKHTVSHDAYSTWKDIAIVGMAAVLPGASNVKEFWGNLCGGVESVGPLPSNRRDDLEHYLKRVGLEGAQKLNVAGFIYEIDQFDHEYFKILKREAIAMSPAQRLFLETAYASIEDAGYGGDALKSSKTGVYVGHISDLDGYQYQEMLKQSNDSQSATGALTANISGRLSYFMDFKGPSLIVDSACSASMSALNLACQGIRNGDCEQAIVGGVQLKVLPIVENDPVGIESSDGHTRPFAEEADGTGEGEGVVSILIKPYDQAIKDKDHVYAIIRSIGTNQDGHSVGLSAPNPEAQSALVLSTLEKASLHAEDISYIEAHGTGTKLGDPIEIRALTAAFRSHTDQKQFCAVGSVKSNIGHLYAASGLVSVIKCCLMLKHKVLPATVNIESLNSRINFEDSPFYVNRQYKSWDADENPRRCGVSNFGFSGTNCHVVLEEIVDERATSELVKPFPFVLSATSRAGLKAIVRNYYDYLLSNSELRLSDISYTTSMGRGHDAYRLAIVAKDTKELIRKLGQFDYSTNTSQQIYVGQVKVIHDLRKGVRWGELSSEDVEQLNESTKKYIANYVKQGNESIRDELLERLCGLYVRGSMPCWNDLFSDEDCKKESLPTYVFNRNRCWPEF